MNDLASIDLKTFQTLFRVAPIPMATIDSSGKFLESNRAFQKFLGYSIADIQGKHFSEITHADDQEIGKHILHEIAASRRESYQYEKRYIHKDGSVLWGRVSVMPVRNDQGALTHNIAIINDISALMRSVEDQTHLLSLLEATIEATVEGLLVVDTQGKIVTSNRRFSELWKIPEEMIARKNDDELLKFVLNQLAHPDQFISKVHEVYANRELETFDILEFRDGRMFARSSRPQRVHGKITGVVWSFRDITAQKQAEATIANALAQTEMERRRAEQLSEISKQLANSLDYETTLQAITKILVPKLGDWCVIIIVAPDGMMRVMSVSADPTKAEIAKKLQDCIPDPHSTEGIPRVIRTGKSVLYSSFPDEMNVGTDEASVLARKLGIHSYMAVPLIVRGQTIGAVSTVSSKPERTYGQSDLAFLEELGRRFAVALDSARHYGDALRTIQVREDFLSIASHELRTPLSPLRMQFQMAEVYAKQIPDTVPVRKDLLELMTGAGVQVDRLLRLVDNLLDVSRITAGRLNLHIERFDLANLITEIAKRYEPILKKADCELKLDLPKELFGEWDKSRIEQVVLNLFSNAIKFGGGKVIEISLLSQSAEARLSMRDYGIGIAAEDLDRIFHRFERSASVTHFGGLGLGLYISREIVEAHSGKISAQSTPGQGACFTVRLPLISTLKTNSRVQQGQAEPNKPERS